MSESIVIATGNKGKLKEFREILKVKYEDIFSLSDYKNLPEIIENGSSFRENALIKAKIISEHLKTDTIADDSGLVVESLDGAPGIYSARYAGEGASDQDNIKKLLDELGDSQNRRAKFVCSIAYVTANGDQHFFDGECSGLITKEEKGNNGFGYDPVFFLPDYGKTMAEIPPDIKNKISHRAKALRKLLEYLK